MSEKKVTGIKVFDGIEYYSFQGICRLYLGGDGRLIVDDFVRTLTKLGIFNKESKRYVNRVHYKYKLTGLLSGFLEGNYIIYGSPSTQKIYFNDVASELLVRIYKTYKEEEPPINKWEEMIEKVVDSFIKDEETAALQAQIETIEEKLEQFKEVFNTRINDIRLKLESLKIKK